MITIKELAGALQHSILHQTSTDFTGLDHGSTEMLAGSRECPIWYLESTSPLWAAHLKVWPMKATSVLFGCVDAAGSA
jgi:hypothetical protein